MCDAGLIEEERKKKKKGNLFAPGKEGQKWGRGVYHSTATILAFK